MEGALHFEKTTNEFFLLVKDYLLRYYRPNNHEVIALVTQICRLLSVKRISFFLDFFLDR